MSKTRKMHDLANFVHVSPGAPARPTHQIRSNSADRAHYSSALRVDGRLHWEDSTCVAGTREENGKV
jgi:hypothetical protein